MKGKRWGDWCSVKPESNNGYWAVKFRGDHAFYFVRRHEDELDFDHCVSLYKVFDYLKNSTTYYQDGWAKELRSGLDTKQLMRNIWPWDEEDFEEALNEAAKLSLTQGVTDD